MSKIVYAVYIHFKISTLYLQDKLLFLTDFFLCQHAATLRWDENNLHHAHTMKIQLKIFNGYR